MEETTTNDYHLIFDHFVEVLSCGICLSIMENPKHLDCHHSFCSGCIKEMLMTQFYGDFDYGKYLTCPMCSKITLVGDDNPDEFLKKIPRNYQLEKLCDLIKNSSNLVNDSMNNLTIETKPHNDNVEEDKLHNKNLRKYFCNNCEELVCRVCEIVGHRDHTIVDVTDIYKNQKSIFMDLLENNTNNQILISDAILQIDTTVDKLKQCEEDITANINQCLLERIKEITEIADGLKNQLTKGVRLKLKKLDVQKDALEMELGKMRFFEEISNKYLSINDPIKVLSIKRHVKKLCNEFQTFKIEPEEDDSIVYNKNSNKLNDDRNIENIIGTIDIFSTYAELSFASGDGIKNAIVNEPQSFQVVTIDRFGNSIAVNKSLQVNITSSNNHLMDTNISIKDHHDGTYLVNYIPRVIGKHAIEITIGDCAIRGSPFYVNAYAKRDYELKQSIQPFKIGAYGTKVKEFKSPLGVASNNNEEIFVCDSYNHRLQVLGKRGEQLGVFGSHGQKIGYFSCPSGIDINSNGDIIVVSELTNHRVQLFHREALSTNLNTERETFILKPKVCFGKEGFNVGNFRSPMGICFNGCGDKFFVCDRDNARIQLMSTEGPTFNKFRFSPTYTAIDTFKNQLYVTDSKNNLIVTFDTRQGSKPISTVSCLLNSSNNTLSTPKGIDFDLMGNVIISDSGNSRVVVLHSDGTVIAEFPSANNANNLFKSPEDISVLSCGKIVVTDILNHQIISF